MAAMVELEIDGAKFEDLRGFYDELTRRLGLSEWGRNLDALDDLLYGGFGTPSEGLVLHWRNSDLSRDRLGHAKTVRVLKQRLKTCHRDNVELISRRIELAARGQGPSIFDDIVEIIRNHHPASYGADFGVELRLE
jgi:RNAse (barnase) inhibitor barstar